MTWARPSQSSRPCLRGTSILMALPPRCPGSPQLRRWRQLLPRCPNRFPCPIKTRWPWRKRRRSRRLPKLSKTSNKLRTPPTVTFTIHSRRTEIGSTSRATVRVGAPRWWPRIPAGNRIAIAVIGLTRIADGAGSRITPGAGRRFIMDAGFVTLAGVGAGRRIPFGARRG